MRPARATTFRSLLRCFSDKVVEPILTTIANGTVSVASAYPEVLAATALLLDSKVKGGTVRSKLDLPFWGENGMQILDEYWAWRSWIRTTPLNAPLPASSYARSAQVRFLFGDIFYGIGLNSPDIWCIIYGELLTRRDLCERFTTEIGHSACCYCDIDTVRDAYYFEHFVPQVQAPYLCVDPFNLYVSCGACNSPQVGKGATIRLPIHVPAQKSIGEYVQFSLTRQCIEVSADANSPADNHIELLKLKTRYARPVVFADVVKRSSRVYETLLRSQCEFSLADLLDYHFNEYAEEPLLHACRAALKDTYAGDVG